MNKAEKKRQHLESLYIKYREGKVSLSELLSVSAELDMMIAKVYASQYITKEALYRTPF
jgi:chromosome condensin MukBEF MukE localization factor